MAWGKEKHEHSTVIYSIYELEDWVKRTRRSAEDQRRFELGEQRGGHANAHVGSDCPTCGWPAGKIRFVRPPAMPGEWAFGKMFACPECWPYPLGRQDAESVVLNDAQQKQLDAAKPRVARLRVGGAR